MKATDKKERRKISIRAKIFLSFLGIIVIALALLWLMDRLVSYGEGEDGSAVLVKDGAFVYTVWAVLLVYMLLLATDRVSTFIYFQF